MGDKMNEHLSHKLKWMSFIATWAVVCIHSQTNRWAPAADDWARSTQSVVSDMFHFAVPLFFAISGFFFVQSFEKYGWAKLLRRKIRVLYVPFVIWATLAQLLLLPIRLYSGADIPDWLSFAGIPLMWTEKCQSVHFWYVRALLIFFILSPIVMFVVRRTWLAALLMLFTLLVPTGSWAASKHIPVALFFFLGGALVGKSEKRFSYVLRVRRGGNLVN